ncbi:MAG: type II toxin-antitoxin system HicB family antitoxin [Spirochaetaceae bacterium]|jgi:predicted HicB family RNase H-like nuclease|nr:type II toxin-antitoxin system HicB family antitoxin [Spirochaetaceae bacterium]
MNSFLHYRGYIGNVEFSEEDQVLHGKVIGIKPFISFEGDTVTALTEDFHNSVNEYIAFCKKNGKRPEKPHANILKLKIQPDIYYKVSNYAHNKGISVSAFVEDTIYQTVSAMI